MPLGPERSRLGADFFDRPTLDVARELIGHSLIHETKDGPVGGVIVETEAYHQSEPACHAFRGPTPRARVLFAAPGTAYVYRSYGIHNLLNVVTEAEGVGAAVLIRALAPTHGVGLMAMRRRGRSERELCSGPGKLTEALGVDLSLNETSFVAGPLGIYVPAVEDPVHEVLTSTRIGISAATDLPWRFHAAGVEHVSRPAGRWR
jgi:DNA-3-methyladenine glycosylase